MQGLERLQVPHQLSKSPAESQRLRQQSFRTHGEGFPVVSGKIHPNGQNQVPRLAQISRGTLQLAD